MDKQIFGKICQSLRQDLFDLSKVKPYSQNDLAEATNIPVKVIGKIERGEKVNIDRDILNKLADAFNLTTVERNRFYLLINRNKDLIPEDKSYSFREMLAYMGSAKIPVLLHDGLFRMLALNQAFFEIYGLTWEYLNDIPDDDLTKYHMVRHMHDPVSPVRATYRTQLEAVAWNNASYWRFLSLAYRHTPLFQQIQSTLLSSYAHFAYLWNGLNNPFPKNDMTGLIRPFSCIHPQWGRLEYSVISHQIYDGGGELFLSMMVPHSEQTLQLFSDLMKHEGAGLFDFSRESAAQHEKKVVQVSRTLTGGNSDKWNGDANEDRSTQLFIDDNGARVEIPIKPQKILFANTYHAEQVASLGYAPYAIGSYREDIASVLEGVGSNVGDIFTIIDIGNEDDGLNFEKVMEIEPDLIIWWNWDVETIDRLQEIAPTIGLNPRVNGPGGYAGPGGPRYSKQRLYASLVGLEDKLEAQIAAYETLLADVKERHEVLIKDLTWSFLDTGDHILPHMYDAEAFEGWAYNAVMHDLGMTPSAAMRKATTTGLGFDKNFGYARVAPESVGEYVADLLFVGRSDYSPINYEMQKLLNNTPTGQADQIYRVDSDTWCFHLLRCNIRVLSEVDAILSSGVKRVRDT
ncbi:MAG: ABC transporter substrate-binding protein [Chloroflexota bacterium]